MRRCPPARAPRNRLLRNSKYFAEGEAKGEAKSILTVLDARGIAVSDQVRETILSCRDLDQLEKWLRRALEVSRAEELLA